MLRLALRGGRAVERHGGRIAGDEDEAQAHRGVPDIRLGCRRRNGLAIRAGRGEVGSRAGDLLGEQLDGLGDTGVGGGGALGGGGGALGGIRGGGGALLAGGLVIRGCRSLGGRGLQQEEGGQQGRDGNHGETS
ncbi:hypothetical protein F0U62_27610 [Cystobacter fuscus]|nr:hypothetical protein F0U62_27610 [Cystobacter fuscus]